MSAPVALAHTISGLVGQKRAVGYKYVCEERALARFRGVLRKRVPRTEHCHASVGRGVDRRGAAAGGEAGESVNSLIAPVRELACWLHRRGAEAYVLPAGGAAHAGPLHPAHLH